MNLLIQTEWSSWSKDKKDLKLIEGVLAELRKREYECDEHRKQQALEGSGPWSRNLT